MYVGRPSWLFLSECYCSQDICGQVVEKDCVVPLPSIGNSMSKVEYRVKPWRHSQLADIFHQMPGSLLRRSRVAYPAPDWVSRLARALCRKPRTENPERERCNRFHDSSVPLLLNIVQMSGKQIRATWHRGLGASCVHLESPSWAEEMLYSLSQRRHRILFGGH